MYSHAGTYNGPTSRTQGAPGNPRPTNTPSYVTVEYIGRADVPKTGVKVDRGMTHDGVGEYLADVIDIEKDQDKSGSQTSDIVQILREK